LKSNHILKMLIGLIALLLLSTVVYTVVRDGDAYQYYTGIGDGISISPDDQKIAFSYYRGGEEGIYTANMDGSDVEKVASAENKQLHDPKYMSDGEQILYLAKNADGTNSLFNVDHDGGEPKQLTDERIHVNDAVFSAADDVIYFIGIDAKEWSKDLGESKEGFDLFSMKPGDADEKQLTDKDYFSMDGLSVSKDGKRIFYSEFTGNREVIRSFSLEDKTIKKAITPKFLSGAQSAYHPQLSPDGQKMAFTAVSKESQKSSLFKYDLFLMDMDSEETERMTDLQAAVDSPVFFHHQDTIAFLENTTWSAEPAQYRLRTIDLQAKTLSTIELDVPESGGVDWLKRKLDQAVNIYTIAGLYTILLGLITVYFHSKAKRIYLPVIVSLVLAVTIFIGSFVVAAMGKPWMGIGFGMLAVGIFVCSLIVLVFAFIYNRIAR